MGGRDSSSVGGGAFLLARGSSIVGGGALRFPTGRTTRSGQSGGGGFLGGTIGVIGAAANPPCSSEGWAVGAAVGTSGCTHSERSAGTYGRDAVEPAPAESESEPIAKCSGPRLGAGCTVAGSTVVGCSVAGSTVAGCSACGLALKASGTKTGCGDVCTLSAGVGRVGGQFTRMICEPHGTLGATLVEVCESFVLLRQRRRRRRRSLVPAAPHLAVAMPRLQRGRHSAQELWRRRLTTGSV